MQLNNSSATSNISTSNITCSIGISYPFLTPALLALLGPSVILWFVSAFALALCRQHWSLRSLGVELSAAMLVGAVPSLGSVAIQALAPTNSHTCALRVICGATSWQMCLFAATLKVLNEQKNLVKELHVIYLIYSNGHLLLLFNQFYDRQQIVIVNLVLMNFLNTQLY